MNDRNAVVWMIAYIISACIVVLIFCGCTTTKYIPIETVRDVYHHNTDTIRDSIRHTVYVNRYVKGDTVYNDRIEYLYKDRWKVHDSIVIQRDSIPYPVEVIKEVEIPVTPWHNYLIIGCLCLTILFLIFKRIIE
jgi:hypothetical protein